MTVVASLSSKGWVSETPDKIDLILSHFFLSDYNQTQLYYGTVQSLKHIIQKNGGILEYTSNEIQSSLYNLLSLYFNSVEVNIEYNDDFKDPRVRLDVKVHIIIYENSDTFNISKAVSIKNSIVDKIIKLNN